MHVVMSKLSFVRRISTAASAVGVLITVGPSLAAAQGVRFTLSPSAEYTTWDKKLGIANGELLGGRIGADFGPLLSVSGYFHTRNGFGVTRDSMPAVAGKLPLRKTSTDAATYGINLALRLSSARLAPFISVGGGVMRFDPDSAPRVEQINYRYGGGIHYDVSSNVRAMVMAEDSRFRLAPGALFPGPRLRGTVASDAQTTRSNWVYSAGLGLAVGGAVGSKEPEAQRWSLASIPLEAFAGRIDFDDATMARQAIVGVRTGIDLGNYVGLRGFYWQGRTGDLRNKQSLNGYGGESQFNFNAARGLAPFLVLGAARLDFDGAYRDAQRRTRKDETALILGGGLGLRLTDQFRLNAAARDYVRGPQQLDSVSGLKQLTNNWMYSVGLSYSINRSRRTVERDPGQQLTSRGWDADWRRQNARTTDSLRMRERALDSARVANMVATRIADSLAASKSNRTVTLPVPTVGELYVRYGDSTGTTVRILTPRTVGDSITAANSDRVRSDSTMRQMQARIDSLASRLRESEAKKSPAPRVETVVIPPMVMTPSGVVPAMQPGTRPANGLSDDRSARQISSISPYVSGFDQLVLGAQVDAGPVFGVQSLRFVPDFAIGLGSDPSVSLAAGMQYNFTPLRANTTSSFRPHLRAGLGFLAASGKRDSEFGVNIAYGVTYIDGNAPSGSRRPLPFIEHQGINFFRTNRFLLGLRWAVR